MIAFLVLSTYFHSQRTRNEEGNTHPRFPETEMVTSEYSLPSMEDIIRGDYLDEYRDLSNEKLKSAEEIEYEEFVGPNGKIKVEYPSHWKSSEDMNGLDQENIEILFTSFLVGPFEAKAGMTVLREDNIKEDDLLEKTENIFMEDATREILEEEETKHGKMFKTKYKSPMGEVRAKEQIIHIDNERYMVSVFIISSLWEDFSEQVDHIMDSIDVKTENEA